MARLAIVQLLAVIPRMPRAKSKDRRRQRSLSSGNKA
jgi:hypothetical protein